MNRTRIGGANGLSWQDKGTELHGSCEMETIWPAWWTAQFRCSATPRRAKTKARRRTLLTVALAVVLLFLCPPSIAEDFPGRVVGITDGDTTSVMHEGTAEKIRLYGIDCPERRQAFGTRARQFTSSLAFGKEVMVKATGKDRYGRTIADVILPDGRNLNRELVKAGYVWWYRKYAPHVTDLE